MVKKTLLFFVIILMCGLISAETLEEITFSSLNYDKFSVSISQNLCKEYAFDRLNQKENSSTYVNLIIENYIPVKENLEISVYLNGNFENKIANEQITKENRIRLSGELKEKNNLKVCINNDKLPVVILSDGSVIGSYVIGEIAEKDFYMRVLAPQTYSSTLIPIEIYAENNSPKDVLVNINYANETFLKISNLETVSGETAYSGIINPEETKILKYYLKTNKNSSFGSPQATLTYTTEFGETKTLIAKQQVIHMVEKLEKLEVYIDLERNVTVNEPQEGKIIIRNVSEDDLKNLTIETSFDNKVVLEERQIPILKKYEVKEIPFKTTIDTTGKHVFNASVYYNVGAVENGINAQALEITADIKTDNLKEIIGVFLFITLIVYIWIVRF